MRLLITLLPVVFMFWTEANSDSRVYKAVGDTVVLEPGHEGGSITSITWKHGANFAMEWHGEETVPYHDFKVRGMLNTSTGELTITGLNQTDSGNYTVEINGHGIGTTELVVISPVSKPSVSGQCNPENTNCTFTCEGSTKDDGPITYEWKANGKTLSSTSVLTITQEEKEPQFQCVLKNPVSSQSSDLVPNPFITSIRERLFLIIPSVGLILLLCGSAIFGFIKFRKDRHKWTPQDGTSQEMSQMLPEHPEVPVVVSHDANNQHEIQPSTLTSVQLESPHANGIAVASEAPGPLAQDPTCPASSDDSKEAEKPVDPPVNPPVDPPGDGEMSSENLTCAASPDPTNEADLERSESSAAMPSSQETLGEDLPVDQQPAGDLPEVDQNCGALSSVLKSS
uniref:uncharacterized protein LOC124055641 isoform X2 n=1 Tax=Scatophagus argus TaxID=75038 RepID=UPI001ED7CFA0|nr:uncharacterized protein LOC124055641 isoform X2 [Scatophagus argus]